jgi:hypothetical protein
MAEDKEKKRMVRFDFPPGLDAEAIAKAIREHGRRILEEAAEAKKAAEPGGGCCQPEPPAGLDSEQAVGRARGEPGASLGRARGEPGASQGRRRNK